MQQAPPLPEGRQQGSLALRGVRQEAHGCVGARTRSRQLGEGGQPAPRDLGALHPMRHYDQDKGRGGEEGAQRAPGRVLCVWWKK